MARPLRRSIRIWRRFSHSWYSRCNFGTATWFRDSFKKNHDSGMTGLGDPKVLMRERYKILDLRLLQPQVAWLLLELSSRSVSGQWVEVDVRSRRTHVPWSSAWWVAYWHLAGWLLFTKPDGYIIHTIKKVCAWLHVLIWLYLVITPSVYFLRRTSTLSRFKFYYLLPII
jgi:hypothetical protein